ncbi:MAG TPA: BNR-repeat neuraminidase N-terminal domain-containing protein, partial [Bacteroidales bacterium]|nr:BNR-repeat neuraminidase N-terminal domain-containing protein [Bacteroidales bacterium]
MKKFTLVWAAFLLSLVTLGQSTANYAFTTNNNGSLVDMSTGTTQLVAAGVDDSPASPVTSIGFTFTFMGVPYTQFSVNANGLIRLGGTQVGTSANTQIGGTATTPYISAFSLDMKTGTSGKVHYKVNGTAPNRTLVIEWLNMAIGYSASVQDGVFQVLLNETTGVIQIIYGNMVYNYAPGTTTVSAGIQSSNTDNTYATINVNTNVVTTTGAPTNYNLGTTVPVTLQVSSSANGLRRYYTFTPPAGAPANPTSLTFTAVGQTGMTVNWVDNSTNEILFVVTRALDAGFTTGVVSTTIPSTTMAGTGTAYNLPLTGLTPGTTYYFNVAATMEGSASSGATGSQATLPIVPMTGNWYIDPAGSGPTNFTSFTNAINYLNINGVGAGGVNFLVVANGTFIENCPTITATGTSSNPITFVRNGTGANPVIVSGIGTGSADAIVTIKGGDYITFDGIDLVDNPNNTTTTTQAEYGYYITNVSATDGAQYNTIKNCKISLARTNTSTKAIYQYYSVTPTNATGTQSYNKYYNLAIESTYSGIYLYAYSTTYTDVNVEVGTIGGGTSYIGAASGWDIGGAAATCYGIYAYAQTGLSISNTEIRNLSVNGSYSIYGIYTSSCLGTCNLFSNKIHDLRNQSVSATTAIYPIYGSLSGTATMNIYNNFIFGITSAYTGSASTTKMLKGIYLLNATSTFTYNVSFNSVRIDGSGSPNISSSCFELSSVTGKSLVRDNIFANLTVAQSTAGHWCWVSPTAGSIGATGSVSNYNDLYLLNTTGGYIGQMSSTNYATLANWQASIASPNQPDLLSKNTDPMFVSPTDLHAQAPLLDGQGLAIAGITTDIDGQTRSTPPDIGADEYTPVTMVYTSCTATQTNFASAAKGSTNNEVLGVQIVMTGSLTPLTVTQIVLNTNGTDAPATDITNAKLWTTGSIPTFSATTAFGTTIATPSGPLTFNHAGLTLLPGPNYFWLTYDVPAGAVTDNIIDAELTKVVVAGIDRTPTVSAPTGYRVVRGPLSGVYTINPAGTGVRNFTSFFNTVRDLGILGIGGAVTFNVAAGATFNEAPLTISTTGTLANTVTFQKDGTGANPVINFTGTTATNDACFKLNGVDYYTFDGLVLQDAGTAMEYGFWLAGASGTDGAQNNTVKNCTIDLNKVNTSSYGVYFSSSATTASGTNSNNKFYANTLQDCYNGYYLYGMSATYNDDNNEIGDLSGTSSYVQNIGGGSSTVYGVYLAYQTNLKVHHTIFNNLTGSSSIYGIYEGTGANNTTSYYNNSFNTLSTTGSSSYVYGIYGSVGTTHNIHDNTIYDLSATNTYAYVYGIYLTSGTNTINNNSISTLRITNASGYYVYGMYLSGTANTVYSNDISGFSSNATSYSPYGIYLSAGNNYIYQNSIHGISSPVYSVYGIYQSGGTTTKIYKNSIYDIEYSGSGSYYANGYYLSSGTTNLIYNNFIYDIKGGGSTGTPGVRAIVIAGGTNDSLSFNTVYLDYRATAATNQSAALYLSGGTTVFMKSNIFVNKTNIASGLRAVALYKSSSSITNMATTNNNNLFYCGIPGPANLIAYDGTTSYPTVESYKLWMTPRETSTITEDPVFRSNTSPYDLHLDTHTETQCESGGAAVTGITDDIDSDPRYGSAGYRGTGYAPDMGADEFDGIPLDLVPPTISYTALPDTAFTGRRKLVVTILDPSGIPQVDPGLPMLYYNINSGSWNGVQAVYNSVTGKFEFSFAGEAVAGDIIKYFVVAQDRATNPNVTAYPLSGAGGFSINPPNASTPPSDPSYYVIIQPICGSYTIDNTAPTDAHNFTSFDDAFIALNSHGICGAVTFNVIAGETFTRNIPAGSTYAYAIGPISSVTKPIVFQKYGEGSNPVVQIAGTSSTSDIGFFLYGSDYVTFDGIDVLDGGSSSSDWLERAYYLQGPSGDNCNHCTITHCMIDLSKENVNSKGIMTNGANATSAGNGNNYNTFSNNTIQDCYNGIYLAGTSSYYELNNTITGNTIQSLGHNLNTTLYALYSVYQTDLTVTGNIVDGAASASTLFGFYCSSVSGNSLVVSNNTFSNMVGSSTSSSVYGLYFSPASTATSILSGNNIFGIIGGYYTYGLYVPGGLLNTINNNKVSGVSYARSGSYYAYGMYLSGGTTNNVYNNYIYDIKADSSTATAGAQALALVGGTTANVYHNTVYMDYTSKVAGNTSAALYVSTTPSTLNLSNNVFVNNCNMTTGTRAVAFFKSTSSLTNLGIVDNNLYYAGTPGAKNLIFYDGTNVIQTLVNYQTLVAPKETSSVSELPPFESTTPGYYNLHMHPSTATMCESGGIPNAMVTTDYDGDARNASHPDLGADEFAGVPLYSCTIPAPGNTITSNNNICLGNSVTLTLQNPTSGTGVHYQWQSSSNGTSFADIPGAVLSYCVVTPTTTTYYRCAVTCLNGPTTTNSNPVQINFPSSVVSTTPGTRCGVGSVTLSATGNLGVLNWYSAQVGGNLLGTGSPWNTPSISSTTSFYVAAEVSAPGNVTFGTGTTLTSSTGYPTAFGNRWNQDWSQMVYTADELRAAGLSAGPISAITFNIAAIGSSATVNSYTISMGSTTNSTLSGFTTTGLTTCYGPATYTSAVGANLITFTTPFNWDGSSNILLDIRGTGIDATYNATTYYTATTNNTVVYAYSSSANPNYYTSNPTANTSTSRLNVIFAGTTGCAGPRSEVVATVIPPPALAITPTQTICNGEILQMRVNSTISDFNTFTWLPVTNLYTDAACTTPYTAGTSATLLYVKSTTAVSTAYTCTATNTSSGCVNTATSTITTLPVLTISAMPASICVSGISTISISPTSGFGTATVQWQDSPDNVTFTDITGATSTSFTTPTLTATRYYKAVVRKSAGGSICSELNYTMTVNNPQLIGATPATRCGTGTVQLTASVSAGSTARWYTVSSGGAPVGTGSPWTTPVINTTTTYYVGAEVGFVSGSATIGAGASTSSSYESPFYHLYGGKKSQYLFLASELLAAGVSPGNITSLSIEVVTPGISYNSFNISLGSTSQTAMTTTLLTGLSSVYSVASTTPVAGINTYTFTSPYYWDGISNLVVETCWSNNNTGGTSTTVKYDATSFVSHGYYRVDSQTPSVVCSTTTGTSTQSSRPKMTFAYTTGCASPRTAVVATVTPAPAMTITTDQTVCNSEILPLTVTSGSGDYDQFTWSPVTNLFTNAACTTPYTTGTNAMTVYVKSTTGAVTVYTCSANNSSSGCSNVASTTITTLPVTSIVSSSEVICIIGTSTLSLSPATGYGTAAFQWQDSPDNVTFSDISGATNTSYTTGTLSATRYYKVVIKKSLSGPICSEPTYTQSVNSPQIISTVPATRCGTGTVQLAATANPGAAVTWYSESTGGSALGTGSPWTTPVISSTVSFWVSANAGGQTGLTIPGDGGWNHVSTTGSFQTSSITGAYMILTAYKQITLNTMDMYPSASLGSSFALEARTGSASGTTFASYSGTTTVVNSGTPTVAQTIPVNWVLPAGTYYIGFTTNPNTWRTSATHTFLWTLPDVVSIDYYLTPSYQYYLYNLTLSTACESARTEVQATVTPAPPLYTTASTGTCPNVINTISVISTLSDYDTYTWSPVTNLYTDAACTVPYTALTNASTVYFKSSVVGAVTYTCNASNAGSGCSNTATTTMTVNPPVTVTATATPSTVCSGNNSQLQVVANQAVPALASDYTFGYSAGTYTSVTGGTVLGTITNDDELFNGSTTGVTGSASGTGFPIGFNFKFGSNVFDRFAVSSNGYIVLGNGTFTIAHDLSTAIATSTLTGFANLISAFDNDLQGKPGSELSFLTTGTTGNQVLTVQWKQYRPFDNDSLTNYMNFQIKLYEGSNLVKLIYGPNAITTSETGQVGLRMADNTDVNTRETATDWSATVLGTYSSTCAWSSTVYPANGATFTFTPPAISFTYLWSPTTFI